MNRTLLPMPFTPFELETYQSKYEHNVRVNVISPGATRSARFMATRKTDPAMMAEDGLKRYGLPKDIANAVAFFASDEASFVSGQVLRVDGGWALFPG